MDAKTINKFPIRDYLAGMGVHPAKDRGYYGLYHSPLREDRNPSMKVDYGKNLWIDYGANDGGTLIDLVMRLERCDAGQAMRLLEQKISGVPSFSFHGNTSSLPVREPTITIGRVQSIENFALLAYLKERGINVAIAREHCSEVHYSVDGKRYFAVGFRNDAGGWELRNAWFKGCIMTKNITTIDKGSDKAMLFEGFIDFLSYLTLKNIQSPPLDVAVLNSVANLRKAIPFLESHRTIYTFFDNDEAGNKATSEIIRLFPTAEVVAQSRFYIEYKDLNDYLRARQKQAAKPIESARSFSQQSIRRKGRSI